MLSSTGWSRSFARTPDLGATDRDLLALLGLQRARVRVISLRSEQLFPAERAVHQLTLGTRDDKARDLESALDRARGRYGFRVAVAARPQTRRQ